MLSVRKFPALEAHEKKEDSRLSRPPLIFCLFLNHALCVEGIFAGNNVVAFDEKRVPVNFPAHNQFFAENHFAIEIDLYFFETRRCAEFLRHPIHRVFRIVGIVQVLV